MKYEELSLKSCTVLQNSKTGIMMEIGSIHCALFVPMWINYDLKRTCTFKLTIFVKKKIIFINKI